jgi:hypothetical protein
MKATRKVTGLAVIVFSLTAIIISGCSSDSRITGTETEIYPDIDKDLVYLNSVLHEGNNAARIIADNNDSESERFSILAKVQRIDVEGGCWYLESNSGDTYTPVSPDELSLKQGMKLKADGYVDKDVAFFCGNGPAFVIEEYEIIDEDQAPGDDRDWRGLITDNDMAEDRDPARGDNERYQDDPSDRAVELKKKFEEERKSKEPSEERAPEMVYDDDNESPEDQADDRYLEDMRDRDRLEKKKLEEERRSKDPSDRDQGRSGDLFDPESSERIQPF